MSNKIFAAAPDFKIRFFLTLIVLLLTILNLTAKAPAETLFDAVFGFEAKSYDNFLISPLLAPTSITVNTTAQSPGATGDCTLGEAIVAANTDTTVDGCLVGINGENTITLPAGIYTLNSIYFSSSAGANALPGIQSNIIINGAGAGDTIIERGSAAGTPDFRFFAVNPNGFDDPGIKLTLNDVTLRNGRAGNFYGGAVWVHTGGGFVANDCVFSNNRAASGGVIGSNFDYTATVNNSTFMGNSATDGSGGVGYGGSHIITNSVFTSNSATDRGGAIFFRNGATVSGSTFSGNTAGNGGGAIADQVAQFLAPLDISNSSFSGNSVTVDARDGGAILAANVTLTGSSVSNNSATGNGGGIANHAAPNVSATVTNSTISGNTAEYGGGIYGGQITLNNSTVSGNQARESGGGVNFQNGFSAGNATITDNRADSNNNNSGHGGGIYNTQAASANINIRNSIIAGNIHFNTPDCYAQFGAALTSGGYNLIGNNENCNITAAAGDQIGTPDQPINPVLDALANNGGATQTHKLLEKSPAIDAGNPNPPDGAGNNCFPADQRGANRPADGDRNGAPRCDTGAFEVVPLVPTSLAFRVQPSNRTAGQIFSPAVEVEVRDQFGILMSAATAEITISLANNPGGGALSGTLTRATVGGIASFDDVFLNRTGTGYTLQAASGGLTAAVSNAFNISAGNAAQLAFVVQPATTNALAIMPTISVAVQDQFGNTKLNANNPVTLAFQNNAGGGILSGTLTRAPSSGIAAFNDLFINNPATGYTLRATAAGLTPADSDSFDITRPTLVVTKTADTDDGRCDADCSLREAIRAANRISGADVINFNISGAAPFTIMPTSALPVITSPVTIDGASQPGFSGSPVVGVNGSNISSSAGLVISQNASGSTIRGLLISGFAGSDGYGILVNGSNNVIKGNFIGTDFSGAAGIANQTGIRVNGANNHIGGTSPSDKNVISGNSLAAIALYFETGNVVQGNYIGRNAGNTGNLGNGVGVYLRESANNTIGGTGAGNVIAGNGVGVEIDWNTANQIALKNQIRGNSMYENTQKGISLSYNRTTRNDPRDPDTGPNKLQNFPVLNLALSNAGTTTVRGTINSVANQTFTLEFFANPTCAASGYGEGRTPLGTASAATDRTGIAAFNVNFAATVTPGHFITATATDADGNTSEFSGCEPVGDGASTISGRVVDSNNNPLSNRQVALFGARMQTTLTDRHGNYSFADLPIGDYTVAPSQQLYNFSPPSRQYSNLVVDQTNQDFVGTRASYAVTVEVKALRAGSLYALGQVTLTVSGDANQTKQTDANGRAVFNLPPSGNCVITPTLANYAFGPPSRTLPNPLTGDLTINFTAQLQTPAAGRLIMNRGGSLYSANADGSGLTYLREIGGYPDLSRDGSQIVWGTSNRLFAANYDGIGATALMSENTGATFDYPRWSPDMAKVAYVRSQGSSAQARMLNVADGTTTNLPAGKFRRSWSPDSAKIAFERLTGTGQTSEIFSADTDGANLLQLTNDSGQNSDPDFSPDGTKIVYVRHRNQLVVMNAGGTSKVVFYTAPPDYDLKNPVWSPDGNKIAFIQYTNIWTPGADAVFLIGADGNNLTRLPFAAATLAWGAEYQAPTPPGGNVSLTSGRVSLNFAGVFNSGQTTISPIPPNSAGSVPGAFQIYGAAYEISTTAVYAPPVTVCFAPVPYDSEAHFNTLALLHNENGVLVDRTTSRNFSLKQICGVVNSLSPFALAEQIDETKPQISGLVLDSNGNPMSGVRMFLTGEETKETETDTDGSFRFVNLAAGANYNVQPKQTGYVFNEYSQDFINVSGDQTVVFAGTANGFSISGRVTDGNGNGVGNVTVQLNNGALGGTTTDADGDYTFAGLPADGAYAVSPFDGVNNFSPFEAAINPLLADVGNVDFTQFAPTSASVSVGGRVMTADGLGIRRAQITLTEADGTIRTVLTGGFGYYRFDGIETGQTIVISVSSKRFVFPQPTQIINVTDNIAEANFTADP